MCRALSGPHLSGKTLYTLHISGARRVNYCCCSGRSKSSTWTYLPKVEPGWCIVCDTRLPNRPTQRTSTTDETALQFKFDTQTNRKEHLCFPWCTAHSLRTPSTRIHSQGSGFCTLRGSFPGRFVVKFPLRAVCTLRATVQASFSFGWKVLIRRTSSWSVHCMVLVHTSIIGDHRQVRGAVQGVPREAGQRGPQSRPR